jgi:hypothetical protein
VSGASQEARNSPPLNALVRMLPTPLGREGRPDGGGNARGSGSLERGGGIMLSQALKLLPTPNEADKGRASDTYGRGNPTLRGALRMLPTPVAADGREKGGGGRWSPTSAPLEATIKDELRLLPTPTSASYQQGGTAAEQTEFKRILGALPSSGATTGQPSGDGKPSTGLRLSPSFVEWMLGAPAEWSDPDCPLSATEFKSKSAGSPASTSSGSSENDS